MAVACSREVADVHQPSGQGSLLPGPHASPDPVSMISERRWRQEYVWFRGRWPVCAISGIATVRDASKKFS
jgi:hypothetical protein